jgi:hypothetical protein
MEMKPFDLERARAGDPIAASNGTQFHFVGLDRTGDIVIQDDLGNLNINRADRLYMAPKKTTFYVNVYKAHYGLWCGTPETTVEQVERARKDDHGTESPSFYKVVSFEVEE